ncbi:hypothetical protein [Pedobacter insulae]|uniref:MG2 domain-containing protein n=1 Tax=Pedobacter insulae TaxID=414048 RepID=A0A1I2T665_9SPHI|nr:hypothetical protein [Pedobacter insulae]SFG60495.1 hypothetical protein SAMN04489864_101226 [Pedobacter insulae]
MSRRIFIGTILIICMCYGLKAQQKFPLSDKIEFYHAGFPKEKLYLSLDKSNYNAGDTLYFKSILLNGKHTTDTALSGKIYVELFNDSARLIERKVFALNNGLGFGDFALNKILNTGSYTIRAYSNWQQNFGADYFFQKSFFVGNVKENAWLLETDQKLNANGNGRILDLNIKITNINKQPVALRDIEIYLMGDQKRLIRADRQTSIDGTIAATIPLSEKELNGAYYFFIIDKTDKSKKLTVPILLHDLNGIDLQYMPEGGVMVNGIYGKVAFKALDTDGLGREIEGSIVNNTNEVVSIFKSIYKGMGSFYLLPKKGERYTAVYKQNGKEMQLDLPLAKDNGTTMRIDHLSKPDSLLIYIKASESKRSDQHYELIAQAGDENLMALSFSLKNGFTNLKLAKNIFPDGIIHFTLFSPDQLPLNERQVFINNRQKIELALKTNKYSYKPRDSISLEITSTKENGLPLSGAFSISVIDNSQVKEEAYEENIASYFLLQSNLKGNIEDPSWYFANNDPLTLAALDHLLLTQGWTGYNWNEILESNQLVKFNVEKASTIQGKVTGLIKKPLSNINLTLLSLGKNSLMMTTTSDLKGEFSFFDLPLIDTANYVIKASRINGKTPSSNIYVDEFIPSLLVPVTKFIYPLYVNANDTTINFYRNGAKRLKQEENRLASLTGNLLKEVEIKGFRKDLLVEENWDARPFISIGEEELKKMPRKKLLDVMKEKLPGFARSRWWQTCETPTIEHAMEDFVVGTQHVSWIRIDKAKNVGSVPREFFEYLFAEDVKHIEIYKGCVSYYLDITTRTGDGVNGVYKPNGLSVYRPLVINMSKEFYSPKYGVNHNSTIPDLRSTIFWDANVVTDENGKAKLSFYAADLPGSYTIKVEGTDLMGRFGYQKSKVIIVDKGEPK